MRHLVILALALMVTLFTTSGPVADTCSTGFLVMWVVFFALGEFLNLLVESELAS